MTFPEQYVSKFGIRMGTTTDQKPPSKSIKIRCFPGRSPRAPLKSPNPNKTQRKQAFSKVLGAPLQDGFGGRIGTSKRPKKVSKFLGIFN